MEKQRIRKRIIKCARLLTVILSLKTLHAEQIVIRASGENFYTNRELAFSVQFPNVQSDEVTVDLPKFPNDVQFVSMQKTNSGNTGEVRLWLLFKKAKMYLLPPLQAKIQNRTISVSFAPIVITEDPAFTVPRLIIKFDNGKEFYEDGKSAIFSSSLGEKIYFTVYAQYALRVLQLSSSVLKTSMLSEIKRYEIKEHAFSDEKIALARFSWQPLGEGEIFLPAISMRATSYSGEKLTATSPNLFVTVRGIETKGESQNKKENYFPYAFHEIEIKNSVDEKKNLSLADCKKIAKLRSAERHAFFSFAERRARKNFEKKCGIEKSVNETSIPFTLFAFAAALFFVLISAMLFMLKKKTAAAFFAVLTTALVFFASRRAVKVFEVHAVFLGGTSYAVPNENAAVSSTLSPGMRVRVTEESAKWFYVQQGTNGAWVLHDAVLKIK